MNISDINNFIVGNNLDSLSLSSVVLSLLVGLFLSILIRWHFVKYGSTLSNREEFSQVFPFILLTTVLVIAVVKSSLALSLGLVGALSIVRFRTPIKEPEELAYLFISIAAGLGLGANQITVTVVSVISILGFMALLNTKSKSDSKVGKKLFISIDIQSTDESFYQGLLAFINSIMMENTDEPDLRRFDIRGDSLEMLYLVNLKDEKSLENIINQIKSKHLNAGISFLDQNNLPGV